MSRLPLYPVLSVFVEVFEELIGIELSVSVIFSEI
jgi:hypothetical protein